MKSPIHLLLTCVMLHSSFDLLHAAPPPELTVLRQQYDKVFGERVTAPHEANVTALDAKFTTALDNAIAQAKAAGDLPTVLAIQADKKLLTEKQPLPEEDVEGTPEALKKLRVIYRDQLARLTEQRATNATALIAPYAVKLQALEATLTKNDRVEEAKEVMDYRVSLKADAPAAPAAVAAANTPPAVTAPAQRGTAAMKPSDAAAANRELAEWCLNNRHEIDIEIDRRRKRISNLQDLPKDKYEVLVIEYRSTLPAGTLGPFPWPSLRAAPNMTSLYLDLDKKEVSMADIASLGALTQLDKLELGGEIRWVDFNAQQLPVLPELRTLLFRKAAQDGEIAVLREKFPKLSSIMFANFETPGGVSPQKLEQLSAWRSLVEVRIDGTQNHLTAAHIAALAKLPDVRTLSLYPFHAVIDPSIKTLTRIDKVKLSYGCPAETFHIVATMPSVTSFMLSNNDQISDGHLSVLSGLTKLTELKLYNMPALTDASAAHIIALKTVASLDVSGTPFTDAVLPELAKMKKLKKLTARKTSITDAGADSFKKRRPDVEFVR